MFRAFFDKELNTYLNLASELVGITGKGFAKQFKVVSEKRERRLLLFSCDEGFNNMPARFRYHVKNYYRMHLPAIEMLSIAEG